MLPLDTVNADGVFRYASSKWFSAALQRLAATGIRGVAVDVWWGAVERRPRRYDWAGYRQLFALVRALGLKLQVVMSFHACGGNVGDNAQIPLPQWVLQVGESDPDIFFTDRPRDVFPGQRNRECISFFADEEPGLLRGRSPMQCYVEFMR
jgi:beta-amylase